MITFVQGVSRVLRINGVIQGDDDTITSFSSTQHRETLNLAKIAIQSTLTYLIAEKIIPYEFAEGEIAAKKDQRIYTLPTDFIRMKGKHPFLLQLDGMGGKSENRTVSMYPQGEDRLKRDILDYKEQKGLSTWFYFVEGQVKQIGLYQVPDEDTYYSYQYEKNVFVDAESDILPFHNKQEAYAFTDMASQYFFYLYGKEPISAIYNDPIFKLAHTSLIHLMQSYYPAQAYGRKYK